MFLFLLGKFPFRLSAAFMAIVLAGLFFVPFSPAQSLPDPFSSDLRMSAESSAMMRGFRVYPDQPFVFDFLIEPGFRATYPSDLAAQSQMLIRYFVAALTIPEQDLWVNLSPYEKERIIPDELGHTALGQVMLQQDYELKKLTAAYLSVDHKVGRVFWDEVYRRVYQKYEVTEIPLDTFNKIWIKPDSIGFYQSRDTVLIVKSRLKLQLQTDDQALEQSSADPSVQAQKISALVSDVVREKVLPYLEEEINLSETFAPLRQMFHSVALAVWLKHQIKDAPLARSYLDQKKTGGIRDYSVQDVDRLYARYLDIFGQNHERVREDYDAATQSVVVKRYTSGGIDNTRMMNDAQLVQTAADLNFQVSAVQAVLDPYDFAMMVDDGGGGIDESLHRGKVVLMTGGTGYLGMAALKNLKDKGSRPVVLTRGIDDELKAFLKSEDIPVYLADLADSVELLQAMKSIQESYGRIDSVVHLAASVKPAESVEKPTKYFQNNVVGTKNLLKIMGDLGIKNLVFASTAVVYKGNGKQLGEDAPIHLSTPYAATKFLMEQMVRETSLEKGIQFVGLRVTNVAGAIQWGDQWYGPGKMHYLNIDGHKKPMSVVLAILETIMDKKREKAEIPVQFTVYGDPVLDFVHVADAAESFARALGKEYQNNQLDPPLCLIANIGRGEPVALTKMAAAIATAAKIELTVNRINSQASGSLIINYDLAWNSLGWVPGQDLQVMAFSAYQAFYQSINKPEKLLTDEKYKDDSENVRKVISEVRNSGFSDELQFEILLQYFLSLVGRYSGENKFLEDRFRYWSNVLRYFILNNPENGKALEEFDNNKRNLFRQSLRNMSDKKMGSIIKENDLEYLFDVRDAILELYGKWKAASKNNAQLAKRVPVVQRQYPANGGIDFQGVIDAGQTVGSECPGCAPVDVSPFAVVGQWDFPSYSAGLAIHVRQTAPTRSFQQYLQNPL